MAEERTTQALPIEEINQLTKTLVDTMADGTPKEIAKGLESQFVDRSTEHLYRKVTPTDQSGSTEVYKYVKGEIEIAFIPTRRDMKLSFPPTCYSSNDPITLLYESNYKLIQFWTLAILENDDVMRAFLDGMLQAGVDGSNVDEFLNTECAVLAHLQQMPMIASIQRKMPDYDDFNRYENMPREHQMIEEAIMSGDTEKARIAAGEHVFRLKEFILSEGEKAFGRNQ